MADYPALPLWTDAYLADTRHLTTVQHGAYLLLLIEAWRRPSCSLPDDDEVLARLAGMSAREWATHKATLLAFWKRDGRTKTWVQKRLSAERMYVAGKSRTQRNNAASRWNKAKKDDATALPNPCQNDAPTPTPTPTLEEEKKEEGDAASAASGRYAFQGGTIRLTEIDLARWRKAYHAIPDILAELTSLDAWFASNPVKQKTWFHTTSGALNRKHQEQLHADRREELNAYPLA